MAGPLDGRAASGRVAVSSGGRAGTPRGVAAPCRSAPTAGRLGRRLAVGRVVVPGPHQAAGVRAAAPGGGLPRPVRRGQGVAPSFAVAGVPGPVASVPPVAAAMAHEIAQGRGTVVPAPVLPASAGRRPVGPVEP